MKKNCFVRLHHICEVLNRNRTVDQSHTEDLIAKSMHVAWALQDTQRFLNIHYNCRNSTHTGRHQMHTSTHFCQKSICSHWLKIWTNLQRSIRQACSGSAPFSCNWAFVQCSQCKCVQQPNQHTNHPLLSCRWAVQEICKSFK